MFPRGNVGGKKAATVFPTLATRPPRDNLGFFNLGFFETFPASLTWLELFEVTPNSLIETTWTSLKRRLSRIRRHESSKVDIKRLWLIMTQTWFLDAPVVAKWYLSTFQLFEARLHFRARAMKIEKKIRFLVLQVSTCEWLQVHL